MSQNPADHSEGASASAPLDPAALDRLLARLRPRLHRYCARMVGSVIDAEDIVQEVSIKAIAVAHNAAPAEVRAGLH